MPCKHAPRPNSGHSTAPTPRFVLRLISRDGVPQACPRVPCGRCAAGLFRARPAGRCAAGLFRARPAGRCAAGLPACALRAVCRRLVRACLVGRWCRSRGCVSVLCARGVAVSARFVWNAAVVAVHVVKPAACHEWLPGVPGCPCLLRGRGGCGYRGFRPGRATSWGVGGGRRGCVACAGAGGGAIVWLFSVVRRFSRRRDVRKGPGSGRVVFAGCCCWRLCWGFGCVWWCRRFGACCPP